MKHSALQVTILTHLCTFVLKNLKTFKKLIFQICNFYHFFFETSNFSQGEAWAAAASRAAAENFFTFIAFLVYLNLKIWSKLENFNFRKNFDLIIFSIFEHVSDLNPGLCSSSGSKNPTQHNTKIVLKCILRIF